MDFQPITDPWFYATAIPAVLLMGMSKSGFASGMGSMAVPLMALSISVPDAAAILMPLLLVMDVMSVTAMRKEVDIPLIRFTIPFALLGTVLGTLLFGWLDARYVAGVVGVVTLFFLIQRLFGTRKDNERTPPRWVGAVLSVTSGFTSFLAHAGGPPIQAYVLPMRLTPLVYSATMACYFFAVNFSKWIPYGFLGLLDLRNLFTSVLLMPFAPAGVWLGLSLSKKIRPHLFYQLIHVGMFLTAVKLIWDGWLK